MQPLRMLFGAIFADLVGCVGIAVWYQRRSQVAAGDAVVEVVVGVAVV